MADPKDAGDDPSQSIRFEQYAAFKEPLYLDPIRSLMERELSEPYSIYVYHYFLHQWPELCFMAIDTNNDELRGVVVCKLERHRSGTYRGYIAMLATQVEYRGKGIATKLVQKAIDAMEERKAEEVVLETEVTNTASLKLYGRLGFLRTKRLHRYYLNGNTAFRLVRLLDRSAEKEELPDRRKVMVGAFQSDIQSSNIAVPTTGHALPAHDDRLVPVVLHYPFKLGLDGEPYPGLCGLFPRLQASVRSHILWTLRDFGAGYRDAEAENALTSRSFKASRYRLESYLVGMVGGQILLWGQDHKSLHLQIHHHGHAQEFLFQDYRTNKRLTASVSKQVDRLKSGRLDVQELGLSSKPQLATIPSDDEIRPLEQFLASCEASLQNLLMNVLTSYTKMEALLNDYILPDPTIVDHRNLVAKTRRFLRITRRRMKKHSSQVYKQMIGKSDDRDGSATVEQQMGLAATQDSDAVHGVGKVENNTDDMQAAITSNDTAGTGITLPVLEAGGTAKAEEIEADRSGAQPVEGCITLAREYSPPPSMVPEDEVPEDLQPRASDGGTGMKGEPLVDESDPGDRAPAQPPSQHRDPSATQIPDEGMGQQSHTQSPKGHGEGTEDRPLEEESSTGSDVAVPTTLFATNNPFFLLDDNANQTPVVDSPYVPEQTIDQQLDASEEAQFMPYQSRRQRRKARRAQQAVIQGGTSQRRVSGSTAKPPVRQQVFAINEPARHDSRETVKERPWSASDRHAVDGHLAQEAAQDLARDDRNARNPGQGISRAMQHNLASARSQINPWATAPLATERRTELVENINAQSSLSGRALDKGAPFFSGPPSKAPVADKSTTTAPPRGFSQSFGWDFTPLIESVTKKSGNPPQQVSTPVPRALRGARSSRLSKNMESNPYVPPDGREMRVPITKRTGPFQPHAIYSVRLGTNAQPGSLPGRHVSYKTSSRHCHPAEFGPPLEQLPATQPYSETFPRQSSRVPPQHHLGIVYQDTSQPVEHLNRAHQPFPPEAGGPGGVCSDGVSNRDSPAVYTQRLLNLLNHGPPLPSDGHAGDIPIDKSIPVTNEPSKRAPTPPIHDHIAPKRHEKLDSARDNMPHERASSPPRSTRMSCDGESPEGHADRQDDVTTVITRISRQPRVLLSQYMALRELCPGFDVWGGLLRDPPSTDGEMSFREMRKRVTEQNLAYVTEVCRVRWLKEPELLDWILSCKDYTDAILRQVFESWEIELWGYSLLKKAILSLHEGQAA